MEPPVSLDAEAWFAAMAAAEPLEPLGIESDPGYG
jgi:hypothetical protein